MLVQTLVDGSREKINSLRIEVAKVEVLHQNLDMIYFRLWQSFCSSCHECFRELRDSKQREQTVCHFLLLHSVYIVSQSFLREWN